MSKKRKQEFMVYLDSECTKLGRITLSSDGKAIHALTVYKGRTGDLNSQIKTLAEQCQELGIDIPAR